MWDHYVFLHLSTLIQFEKNRFIYTSAPTHLRPPEVTQRGPGYQIVTSTWITCRPADPSSGHFRRCRFGSATEWPFSGQLSVTLLPPARVRARAWMPPSPQTERWKQVCLCGNAAVMLLDTQQAAVPLLVQSPWGSPPFRYTTRMEQIAWYS